MTEKLCEAGIAVIATDRRPEDFGPWRDALPAGIREMVSFYPLDVTKEEPVNELAATLSARNIDVAYLVNNAGIQGPGKPWKMETKVWDRVMNVNITGTFHMTRAFSEAMVSARLWPHRQYCVAGCLSADAQSGALFRRQGGDHRLYPLHRAGSGADMASRSMSLRRASSCIRDWMAW